MNKKEKFKRMIKRANLALRIVYDQVIELEEYYASHWRDDDSPQAEKTFGVKRNYIVETITILSSLLYWTI